MREQYDGRLLRPGGATARDRALMQTIDELGDCNHVALGSRGMTSSTCLATMTLPHALPRHLMLQRMRSVAGTRAALRSLRSLARDASRRT